MKRAGTIVVSVVMLALVTTGTALAQDGGATGGSSGEVAALLLPLVSAATAIERIIEMVFGWYEGVVLNLGQFFNMGGDYVRWAQEQVGTYRRQLLQLPPDDPGLRALEDKLTDAENRLRDHLKSPEYTSYKRAIALLMGLVLGVAIALVARIEMFALLNVSAVPDWLDRVITGLIVGTGSAPVHALIGILQNTQDAIDEARGLWRGKALGEIQDVIESINRSQMEALRQAGGGLEDMTPKGVVTPPMSMAQMNRKANQLLR